MFRLECKDKKGFDITKQFSDYFYLLKGLEVWK